MERLSHFVELGDVAQRIVECSLRRLCEVGLFAHVLVHGAPTGALRLDALPPQLLGGHVVGNDHVGLVLGGAEGRQGPDGSLGTQLGANGLLAETMVSTL